MSTSDNHHSNQNVATEAAEWFISLQGTDVSREQQEAFADWLRRSPVHVEEFLQITSLQGDLARLPQFKILDFEKEIATIQLSATGDNVIPLNAMGLENSDSPLHVNGRVSTASDAQRLPPSEFADRIHSSVRERKRHQGVRFLFATVATVAIVATGLWFSGPIRDYLDKEHYKTDIGEQRSLTLADGTQIQLNALSNLSTKIDKTIRELQLDDGEALFKVAKDPAHPFRVHTPQATIEAKGTQFNVHVRNGTTVVSLLEGHVLMTQTATRKRGNAEGAGAEAIPTAVMLNPGESISIADRALKPPKPHSVDLKAAIAWTEHRLVFEDAPLSDVIAEFNRYSRQPFTIDDPTLGDAHITASFDSNSTQTFADSLSAAGGLRVIHQPDGTWLIKRK